MTDQEQPTGIVGENAFEPPGGGVDEVKDGFNQPEAPPPATNDETGDDADGDQIIVAVEGDVLSLAQSHDASFYTPEEVADQERMFWGLYDNYPFQLGQLISAQNRERLGLDSLTLSYAEVSIDVIRDQYNLMYQNGLSKDFGGRFYCFGAGMGKSTMAQLLLHDYESCKGIEILSDLCVVCEDVRKKFNDIKSENCNDRKVECSFQFICADALSIDWSDADVAWIHATMFDASIMKQITFAASKVKTGAFIVCVSKQLESTLFDLLSSKEIEASFGLTNIYLHRRNEQQHPTYLDDLEYLESLGVFKR